MEVLIITKAKESLPCRYSKIWRIIKEIQSQNFSSYGKKNFRGASTNRKQNGIYVLCVNIIILKTYFIDFFLPW